MSDEISPCPFCGGSDIQVIAIEADTREWAALDRIDADYEVVCTGCGGSSARFPDRGEAIGAWNARVADEDERDIYRSMAAHAHAERTGETAPCKIFMAVDAEMRRQVAELKAIGPPRGST